MNELITIDDCVNRYHIPVDDVEGFRALEKARKQVFERALDRAVDFLQLEPESIVCIREMRLPVYLNLSRSTRHQAAAWSDCITREIRRLLEKGDGRSVRRFKSRAQAWIECSAAVLVGDYSESWAWHQMDLLSGGSDDSATDFAASWIEGLCRDPVYLLPIMSGLKDQGLFATACLRITEHHWAVMIEALSGQVGRELGPTLRRCADRRVKPRPVDRSETTVQTDKQAKSIGLSLSRLTADVPGMTPLAECARALLSVAVTDPGCLTRRDKDIEAAILKALDTSAVGLDSGSADEYADEHALDAHREFRWRTAAQAPTAGNPAEAPSIDARVPNANEQDAPGVFSLDRQRASSPVGGLLFLLNLMADPTGLWHRLANDGIFSDRPMYWVWYWLGRTVVAVEPGDCALLAFAGLAPHYDYQEPVRLEPNPEQGLVLQQSAELLRERACERLVGAGMPAPLDLQTVITKTAAITADPGWIDVEFSLLDVDVAVRRAGLDLDPGYLPCIGSVVRFRYA